MHDKTNTTKSATARVDSAPSADHALADDLACLLSAQYARAVQSAVRQAAGAPLDLHTLHAFCRDLASLRHGDHSLARLQLQRDRLALQQDDSLSRYKKKLTLGLEALLRCIEKNHPHARDAYVAFAQATRGPLDHLESDLNPSGPSASHHDPHLPGPTISE